MLGKTAPFVFGTAKAVLKTETQDTVFLNSDQPKLVKNIHYELKTHENLVK